MQQLLSLDISGLSQQTRLPGSLMKLTALTSLDASHCSSLSVVPAGIWRMPALQELHLNGCTSLTELLYNPWRSGKVPVMSLRHLGLYGCQFRSLPVILGELSNLTKLNLERCSSLMCLPEMLGLVSLEELDLSGCSSIEHLPESLAQLTAVSSMKLSHCSSLLRLPSFMGGMSSLRQLDLGFCGSLDSLPRTMPAGMQSLDLSYCRHMETLAVQLVDLRDQMPSVLVKLQGWEALLGAQCGSVPLNDKQMTRRLRIQAIVVKLLTDKDAFMSSLERLSWLAVLLAATTFTGAIAPPGGYDNGMLFLPYSAADCSSAGNSSSSSSSSQAYSSAANCSVPARSAGACPAGASDISGVCVLVPDVCSDGLECRVKPRADLLRAFFVLDLLSFGFSMALVLFVVASSMPRRIDAQAAKFAGIIWLSFVAASLLMVLAVACGVGAMVAAVLAVYPVELQADVYGPFGVMLGLMGFALWGLGVRWVAIHPGQDAVSSGWDYTCERAVGHWLYAVLSVLVGPFWAALKWPWVGVSVWRLRLLAWRALLQAVGSRTARKTPRKGSLRDAAAGARRALSSMAGIGRVAALWRNQPALLPDPQQQQQPAAGVLQLQVVVAPGAAGMWHASG
jgi:hypothetical protein